MANEWFTTCKDCGKQFGYSDASHRRGSLRGMSRPERCPECRRIHSREIASFGMSHFDLTPIKPIASDGISAGSLGGLIRPPRIHEPKRRESTFDFDKFGIKNHHIVEYFRLMQDYQVTVVVAPTGAGKSTFLPYRLMVPPEPFPEDLFTKHGQIVITQPRIQATRNIPKFVAEVLHGSTLGAGFDVGFKHNGAPATDWRNKMVYMTDGTLINMIVRNELGRLGVIMIDEAHERSLNIDLILGLLKQQLPRYPQLKLIIASATIDSNLFIDYYGREKVGFYEFPGKRQFPVDEYFRTEDPIPVEQMSGRMPDEVAKKAFELLIEMEAGREVKGDILAFLHGEKPIERACSSLRELIEDEYTLAGRVDVLPLYTKLPQKAQDAALKEKKHKDRYRVVISTNVAETSLTVEGIVHVVETGLINESQWDSTTQTSFVVPKLHSQAGCRQRWGRAGRVMPGKAHCLYTEEQFAQFPEHTDPEIMRAPLDQIVLTAKAAGIDNIRDFDWIQRPSETELVRAPQFLQQIGALDADGDLTDHGAELRDFTDSADVANLMILADRFGCSVEMATLIAMRKLYGYTALLRWSRNWDAPTKRAVNRIHQGLIGPCLDDVEFYLKIWKAWETATDSHTQQMPDRIEWEQQFFVNMGVFRDIVRERNELLASLSAHKKEETFRPIDLNLLTRVRILLTYGLSTQIYRLNNSDQQDVDVPSVADAEYVPVLLHESDDEALVELHRNAVVEISSQSIIFGRGELPDIFVCGKRQRTRRRISPQLDPINVITASFLTLIQREWLDIIGKPLIVVAQMIAQATRDENGELIPSVTFDRMFIDQAYPVGARFQCTQSPDGHIMLGKLVQPPPRLIETVKHDEINAVDDEETLESEVELGIDDDVDAVLDESTEDNTPLWIDVIEDDDIVLDNEKSKVTGHVFELSGDTEVLGKLTDTVSAKNFIGIVTGFDFSDRLKPKIELESVKDPDPFTYFCDLYQEGQEITVAIRSIENYTNDRLAYLVVYEVTTSLEIVMDPYDVSLIGRNFAINAFSLAPAGYTFSVTIEEIDQEAKRVRATRLKKSVDVRHTFFGATPEKLAEAVIADVRDNGVYVWIEPENLQSYDFAIPAGFVHLSRMPLRPDEMQIHLKCRIKAKSKRRREIEKRTLLDVSFETLDELNKAARTLPGNVKWDELTQVLSVKGQLTYESRQRLLALSDDSLYQLKINQLFRRTNEIDLEIIDTTGLEQLANQQKVPAKIVSINNHGVVVRTEGGFESFIHKSELSYDRTYDHTQELSAEETLDVIVKEIDIDQGLADLTLNDPDADPLLRYEEGMRVEGVVSNITDFGVFVTLEPGVDALIRNEELQWQPPSDPKTVLNIGQNVIGLITKIDRENRKTALTLRLPETDPLNRYEEGMCTEGIVLNTTDFGAFVALEPGLDGLLHISEMAWEEVEDPNRIVKEGQKVDVLIKQIDRDKRQFNLSLKLPETDPIRSFRTEQRVSGTVVGFTKDGSATFVNIAPSVDVYVRKDEIDVKPVANARDVLQNGYSVTVRITDINYVERKVTGTMRSLYHAEIYIPDAYRGLVIGAKGSVIRQIQSSTEALLDLKDNGWCSVTGKSQTSIDAAMNSIGNILAQKIYVFELEEESQIGRLIGKGGENIKQIVSNTGVQIDQDARQRRMFTMIAPNATSAKRAKEAIDSSIKFYKVTIQVDPSVMGRVIGKGGSTIKNIQAQTGAKINSRRDINGRIELSSFSSYGEIETALSLIAAQSGTYTVIESQVGNPPKYVEVVPEKAPRQQKPHRDDPPPVEPIRRPSQPPKIQVSSHRKAPTEPKPAERKSGIQSITLKLDAKTITKLARRQGFLGLFGGKTLTEKIENQFGVKIRVNTSTQEATISGHDRDQINKAALEIKEQTQ